MSAPSAEHMRTAIIQALRKQGYRVKNGVILMPEDPSKDDFRALNTLATQKKLEKSGPGVKPYEDRLIQYIANGHEVVPRSISPKIVPVEPESEHELLFRYACLHCSIPVSAGY